MTDSRDRPRALTVWTSALLGLVLTACQMTPQPEALPQGLPPGIDLASIEVREPLRDEIGPYRNASGRAAVSDDGVLVRVEERFYIDTSQARFVVLQRNLALRHELQGIKSMGLRLYQGDVTLAVIDLTSTATTELAPQELYSTQFFETDMSREALNDRTCAVVDVTFSDETWYPLSLDTCDQRSLALLSTN